VEAREIQSDYQRLADLFSYTTSVTEQEFVAADVIGGDANNLLRSSIIYLNRGARDGVARGMPVITGQGLVGRVLSVSANAAEVMLITAPASAVSARIQSSRANGSIVGDIDASLSMQLLPLDIPIQIGDVIITSGLGGNFPPDVLVGQVSAVQLDSSGLFQVATVRSLINFDLLEQVLVITSFQPVDLSVFDAPEAEAGAAQN
jgi:rod shape-determining protein MreC